MSDESRCSFCQRLPLLASRRPRTGTRSHCPMCRGELVVANDGTTHRYEPAAEPAAPRAGATGDQRLPRYGAEGDDSEPERLEPGQDPVEMRPVDDVPQQDGLDRSLGHIELLEVPTDIGGQPSLDPELIAG